MAIKNTRLDTTSAKEVFLSENINAITTIIVCNTGEPDLSDESVNSAILSMYVVPAGTSVTPTIPLSCKIISKLEVPAGDTVFFSDEKIILEDGDSIWAECSTSNLLSITVSVLLVG